MELSAAEEIDRVKLHAATETEPYRQEIAGMEQALIKYAEYHKPDLFAKKKSLELCFGVIGYRASTKLRRSPNGHGSGYSVRSARTSAGTAYGLRKRWTRKP